jgi:hypothetical protein
LPALVSKKKVVSTSSLTPIGLFDRILNGEVV